MTLSLFASSVCSFYMAQFYGKVLTTALQARFACTDNESTWLVAVALHILIFHVVGVLVTNLLSHRYMVEKAKVMLEIGLA